MSCLVLALAVFIFISILYFWRSAFVFATGSDPAHGSEGALVPWMSPNLPFGFCLLSWARGHDCVAHSTGPEGMVNNRVVYSERCSAWATGHARKRTVPTSRY
ncbi:hypothetical protein BDV10DRAFT_162913 [Aspergillus recurvatus]